jgi:hypothetical protein
VADNEDSIEQGVRSYLEDGETLLATLQAAPRGHTGATATTGVAGMINSRKVRKNLQAGEAAGIVVRSPMGLALTNRRLLTLEISTTKAMGRATGVTAVLSAIPLADVTSVEAKRFGLAGILSLSARGSDVKLETPKVGQAKAFAEAWAGARAPA